MLPSVADRNGNDPLHWAVAPLREASRVLDAPCRGGALAGPIGTHRWVGLDEHVGPIRAATTAFPLADNAVDGAVVMLALPGLPDLDATFAELRRVLAPGGTLVLVVPAAVRLPGRVHRGWRHRSALTHPGWLLVAADFAVLSDEKVGFTVAVPDREAAHRLVSELPKAGLWPPDLPPGLGDRLRIGTLPVPLRRIVARR